MKFVQVVFQLCKKNPSFTEINWLMLFNKMVVTYSENLTKLVNSLYKKNRVYWKLGTL